MIKDPYNGVFLLENRGVITIRLLIASDSDNIAEYLLEQGNTVNNLYSNDLAVKAIQNFEVEEI
ncbi:MAG: hypothetical protein M0T74_14420 [Desulfitobacterium hafniense]|nr:hypothetical protein [Desulfitobacterium hafniense]